MNEVAPASASFSAAEVPAPWVRCDSPAGDDEPSIVHHRAPAIGSGPSDLLSMRAGAAAGGVHHAGERPPLPDVPVVRVGDPAPARGEAAPPDAHRHAADLLSLRPRPTRRIVHQTLERDVLQRLQGLQPPRLRPATAGTPRGQRRHLCHRGVGQAAGSIRTMPAVSVENLQPLRHSCNSRKGARTAPQRSPLPTSDAEPPRRPT